MDALVSFVVGLLKVSWLLIVGPWRALRQGIHGVYVVGKEARGQAPK